MKLYYHPISTTSRPVMLFAAEAGIPDPAAEAGQARRLAAVRQDDRAAARIGIVQPGEEAGRIAADRIQLLQPRRLAPDIVRRPPAAERRLVLREMLRRGPDQLRHP